VLKGRADPHWALGPDRRRQASCVLLVHRLVTAQAGLHAMGLPQGLVVEWLGDQDGGLLLRARAPRAMFYTSSPMQPSWHGLGN